MLAVCLLLEIPLRGFYFHVKFSEKYGIPKNNTTHTCFQRTSFEKEIPLRGIAGNTSQSCSLILTGRDLDHPDLRCPSRSISISTSTSISISITISITTTITITISIAGLLPG